MAARSAPNWRQRCGRPAEKFPTNFDYDVVSDSASAKIKDVSQRLAAAFASGDTAAADALFSNDAV
jgi:hypothetical protein